MFNANFLTGTRKARYAIIDKNSMRDIPCQFLEKPLKRDFGKDAARGTKSFARKRKTLREEGGQSRRVVRRVVLCFISHTEVWTQYPTKALKRIHTQRAMRLSHADLHVEFARQIHTQSFAQRGRGQKSSRAQRYALRLALRRHPAEVFASRKLPWPPCSAFGFTSSGKTSVLQTCIFQA